MATYEDRAGRVHIAVWETWTKNGLRMDSDEREETLKSATDAVTNSYVDGISDADWQAATLDLLGVTKPAPEPKAPRYTVAAHVVYRDGRPILAIPAGWMSEKDRGWLTHTVADLLNQHGEG